MTKWPFPIDDTYNGDYHKGGLAKPVSGLIVEEYDHAAPRGVGAAKVAGNYAVDLIPNNYLSINHYRP